MTQQQLQYAYWQRLRHQQLYRAYAAGGFNQKKNIYNKICRVTQGNNWFLNYIEYDAKNLDSQKAAKYLKTQNNAQIFSSGLCTGIHKGNFVLRQLDWYYNDQVEFIIKMNKCEDKGVKFNSIGMTAVSPKITTTTIQNFINNNTYNEFFDILPFATVDGMNENGIYASSNVVERTENIDNSQGFGDSSIECCYSTSLVRFILDRLESIDKLPDLLNSLHLFSIKRELMDYESHILVCDAEGHSKIIEFVDKNYILVDYSVMTNFRTNYPFLSAGTTSDISADWDSVEWNGIGVERWEAGMRFVNDGNTATLESFKQLRNQFDYSHAYDRPYSSDLWLTDNLSSNLSVSEARQYHDTTLSPERKDLYDLVLNKYRQMHDSRQRLSTNKTWITTHSIIYDLVNLSCNLKSQLSTDECTEWDIMNINGKISAVTYN